MSQNFYTQVPSLASHTHFSNASIEGFPDLHIHDTFEDRRKNINDTLKYQLFTTKSTDANKFVNMRECFKLAQINVVEYCLRAKVPGTSFVEAAAQLGYRKI